MTEQVSVQTARIDGEIENSIKPSIAETERFVCYLNKKFELNLPNDLIITISEAKPSIKGYFRPSGNTEAYINSDKRLNQINLNSLYLVETPYETIAHETAHFSNQTKGVKDCSSNQYHNKHFKTEAEKLLLEVKSIEGKGFAYTTETPQFKEMLTEFKPDQTAFKVFQNKKEKEQKKKGRNLKFICPCGCIVRSARNEEKPLNAYCGYCEGKFEEGEPKQDL